SPGDEKKAAAIGDWRHAGWPARPLLRDQASGQSHAQGGTTCIEPPPGNKFDRHAPSIRPLRHGADILAGFFIRPGTGFRGAARNTCRLKGVASLGDTDL